MADRRAVLDSDDVRLAQSYPLAEQGVVDDTGPVYGVMMGMGAVGAGDSADVLGGERVPELVGLPEIRWQLGWGDELVA